MPRHVLCVELPLHHHLGRNTRMVGARLPQGIVTTHAVVAGQRIHQGILEGVPHVQAAGDIRRRDHDAIGFTFTGRRKVSPLLPGFIPVLLDGVRVVGFFHG